MFSYCNIATFEARSCVSNKLPSFWFVSLLILFFWGRERDLSLCTLNFLVSPYILILSFTFENWNNATFEARLLSNKPICFSSPSFAIKCSWCLVEPLAFLLGCSSLLRLLSELEERVRWTFAVFLKFFLSYCVISTFWSITFIIILLNFMILMISISSFSI